VASCALAAALETRLTTTHDAPADPLQAAIAHHRRGELDAAQAIYAELLRVDPRRADALNFMGVLMVQRGERERALELLKKASMIAPREPGVWNNLGNALLSLGKLPEAEKALRRSLALAESAEALTNLARIQRRRQEWARSEASARRAIALAPRSGEAWHYLSLALLGLQRPEEAFEAAVQAELLLPAHAHRREAYGRALWAAGQHDRAVAFYRDWLDKEPDNPYAQHHLAAALGQTPERASDAYVEKVFDQFAASFDTQLAALKYRAPQLVAEAMAAALPAPAAQFDIADLGCGTGLCGPLLKPWARSLAGCDLSVGMLERAAPRAVYDELVKAELVRFLVERPAAFDVLVSADTLIYFGELAPMFAAAHAALRPGGMLVFTLEALEDADDADFRLAESGRYAHALPGLRARLGAAGFAEPATSSITPRMESARAVAGWLVTVRRD
jgi:predicted TPR repeat methyltransferase